MLLQEWKAKMEITLQQTADILKANDNFYILTHSHPDGDTLGSGYALCIALQGLGKNAKLICADAIPCRFKYLADNYIEQNFQPSFFIAVDVADVNLLGDIEKNYPVINLCIDHHISNKRFAENLLLDSSSAATAELIFDVINELDVQMDKYIACCIYTGIATDTGCFKFSNTTSKTHQIASELINYDFDKNYINYRMFDVKSKARIKLETAIMENMEFYFNDQCALTTILQNHFISLDADENEFDGLAAIPRQIEGVEIGITIKEKNENCYKVSMRSGKVNVSDLCKVFGGGGHIRAAGCTFNCDLKTVKNNILMEVENLLKKEGLF